MRRGKGSPDKNRDQLDKLYAGRMGICAVLLNVLIRGDTGARDLAGLQERARKVGQCNSRYKGFELRTYSRSPLTSAYAPLRVLVAAALIRPANSPKTFCK